MQDIIRRGEVLIFIGEKNIFKNCVMYIGVQKIVIGVLPRFFFYKNHVRNSIRYFPGRCFYKVLLSGKNVHHGKLTFIVNR